jgi:hypothetical protein
LGERSDLLKKLVEVGHVDVAERHTLGDVRRFEVTEIVKSLLQINGVFPDHRGAKCVYEGAILVQVPSGIQIKWERAYPWNPFVVAERRVETFKDVDTAIGKFIDCEWKDGIDGVELT